MADTMESVETITTNKEPVKNEESATSTSNTDSRNEDASSPPPNCSICLGKLINTSFTDSCLHQFCFTCLLQWSRIKTECPLCKQTFKSIIHNVRSEEDYDQYHVPRELAQPPPAQQMISAIEVAFNVERAPLERRRFAYRTTMLHNRLFEIRLNPGQDPLRNIPLLSREERRNRRTNPLAYRRNIYRTGEWSNPVPDIYSRFRECSAEYFRRHPQEHDRLIPWINRELLTLLNANQPHIAYVSRVIMDTLIRYDIRSPEFHETVRPYFNAHTPHFIHELMNYCRSSLSVSDYDAVVTYSPCNPTQVAGLSSGYWNRVQSPISSSTSNSSTSDDSDIRVVEHVDNANIELSRTNVEMPALHVPLTYSELYMPGPSTVGETFQVNSNNNNNNVDNNNVPGGRAATRSPCVLTILSSASSDSDECEVVGYVKPRHERTPEVIELVSSDDERIVTTDNIAESQSSPKISTNIPINDESPCTSNANNEKNNTRSNQKPKSNNLKLNDLTTASLSSSETMFGSDSDSDSDFVIRPTQKRGRNAKRNVRKSDRKSPRKSLRKRNKNSTSSTIDGKRESKRRCNSIGIGGRNGRSVAAIISSSSEDENNDVGNDSNHGGWHQLKVRKDLIVNPRRRNNSRSSSSSSDKSSSSSNSSTSTSSASSSSATSNTTSAASNIFGSPASLNCHNNVHKVSNDDGIRKKNRFSRNDSQSKSKNDPNAFENNNATNEKSSRPKLKSTVVKCQRPVNSTVLRKDVDKKEWYIDNNRQSRSRSRSRSSYESQRDNNLRSSSRRHRHHHHHRRRSNSNNSMDNYRQRRMASKIANEKLKNQSLYSTADSQNDDDDDEIDVGDNTQYNYERSNSQSSTISEKYSNSSKNDKHNSKSKNKTKKKYNKESKNGNGGELLDVASTSTSNQKYSESKNNACGKKRSNSNRLHRKNKDSKQRRMSSSSKPKSRREKRHRNSFSSSSSSSLLSSTSSSSSSN